MSEGRAKTKYVRISPRKARLVATLIRRLPATAAKEQLLASGTKGGALLLKTLNSAIANAETNHEVAAADLVVKEVRVDEGPTLKRARSRGRGGRSSIMKRTSHMTVIVGQEEGAK
jgi:large subunit ribosomal protein L22